MSAAAGPRSDSPVARPRARTAPRMRPGPCGAAPAAPIRSPLRRDAGRIAPYPGPVTLNTTSSASPDAPQSNDPSAGSAPPSPPLPAPYSSIGRIPVTEVFPVIEDGRWPVKAVPREVFPIRATVFREGHDSFGATAVLVRPDGTDGPRARMVEIDPRGPSASG